MDSDREVDVSSLLLHKSSSSLAESPLTSTVGCVTLVLTTSEHVGDQVVEQLEHIALTAGLTENTYTVSLVRNVDFKPKEGVEYMESYKKTNLLDVVK